MSTIQLTFDFRADDLAEQIVSTLPYDEVVKLVMSVLDHAATAELDEELVARIWRGLQGCYEEGDRPTIEDLLARYPKED